MFRKINRLMPVFEKWDFNKLFVNKDLYNFINKSVYPKLHEIKKKNIRFLIFFYGV